ncbi:MAG: lysophospholipid acyltransferase family protein [Halofilum sp. (in: g-proteobacteria)]|nr:lysophospholipid acyltransferase family protein [Halofilum sp. (in: g-proteobacteria)]
MRIFRQTFRMCLAVVQLVRGMWWAKTKMPATPPPQTDEQWALVRKWHRQGLAIVGVHVHIHGERAERPVLFVSNHISWVDISALLTVIDAGFVGKAELARWPGLGLLIVRGGTIFIERGGRDAAANANTEMARRLEAGGSAAVFPEATTTRGGDAMRRFHPRLFDAARRTGARVQPIAITYDNPTVPYVDNEHFLHHFWRLLAEREVNCHIHLLPPIETAGRDRRSIAAEAEAAIGAIVRAQPPVAPKATETTAQESA